ncbi:MAG: glycoside hydrolase family 3 protein [Chlorobiaceae bacterium]|nr:glycoside hydrolase family 3 protein [Chlorobiaceae bacterium]
MKKSLYLLPGFFSLMLLIPAALIGSAPTKPGTETWAAQQIFNVADTRIEATLKNLTLSEKVGQMLIAESDGHYNSYDDTAYKLLDRLVKEGKIGGIMFLKGDAFSAAMLANHFQSLAPRPLLMSADMERGLAMRLNGATEFPPNMALAATQDSKMAGKMAQAIAKEAKTVGLQQSYGPTLDLNINPLNPIINTRSFGDNLPLTIALSHAVIEGLQSNGIIATAKHFPGHGDVSVDSHIFLPVLKADRRQLDEYELKPFKAAIEQGVISVMVGHLAAPELTGTMEPASISKVIVTDLLRKELGFQGLIITDAMNMKALYNGQNVPDISIKAIQAGNDLLLFSPDPELAHHSIVQAVEKGVIPIEQINDSVRRILQAKQWLDIEHRKLVNLNRVKDDASPESHRDLAKKIAEASITLVKDENHCMPLKRVSSGSLLNIILQDKTDLNVGNGYIKNIDNYYAADHIRIDPGTDSLRYAHAADMAMKAPAVIVTSYVQALSGSGTLKLTEKQQEFIHTLARMIPKEKPLIFISLGTPYLINYFPEITTYLCTYSSKEASEEYVVKALKGKLIPRGILPVSLQGNSR